MADGLNRVLLFGNLTRDPELRMTGADKAVLKMGLATSESYLDANRVRQEKTEFHNVVIWGKRAEALGKFLAKGARIFVEGSLHTSSYEDRDGNKRYRTEVVASNIILAGGGGDRGQRTARDEGPGEDAGTGCGVGEDDFDSQEIPF